MRVPNEQARSRSEHSASASAAVSEMRGARATSATGPSTGTNASASTSNTSLLVRMPPDWITITPTCVRRRQPHVQREQCRLGEQTRCHQRCGGRPQVQDEGAQPA
jgi:hypothetical protein